MIYKIEMSFDPTFAAGGLETSSKVVNVSYKNCRKVHEFQKA